MIFHQVFQNEFKIINRIYIHAFVANHKPVFMIVHKDRGNIQGELTIEKIEKQFVI
jgi:hypothetical protein